MKCGHGKIPFGGHCAWTWCPNYRGLCASHKYWSREAYTKPCEPINPTPTSQEENAP